MNELDEFEECSPLFLYCGEFYPDNLYVDESYLNEDKSYLNQDESYQDELYQKDTYQDKSHPDESYQGDSHQDKSCPNKLPSQATYNETSKNDGMLAYNDGMMSNLLRHLKRHKGKVPELNKSKRKQNELVTYLMTPLVDEHTDILDWWHTNESCYSNLAKFARDCLAIPATNVPSEQTFSISSNMLTSKQNRLDEKTV
ncbi:2770_t:CDS:2 [Cetraspora pellucida]|uniref:2770_t:CDS:1 n=1 Tax=Cetraspora pellucida TaxID=1433469 RepID=A0A9N9FM25_9GLOM|nr:2770_t:CDS:2 [Cetraspora pellucida]